MLAKSKFEVRLLDDTGRLIEVALLNSSTERDAVVQAAGLATDIGAADFHLRPLSPFRCAYHPPGSRLCGYGG